MELDYGISRVKVLSIYVSHGEETQKFVGAGTSYTRCCFLLLCGSLQLLVNLRQRFMKLVHKPLDHKSPVLGIVAKLSTQNLRSNCGGNYCHTRMSNIFTYFTVSLPFFS